MPKNPSASNKIETDRHSQIVQKMKNLQIQYLNKILKELFFEFLKPKETEKPQK